MNTILERSGWPTLSGEEIAGIPSKNVLKFLLNLAVFPETPAWKKEEPMRIVVGGIKHETNTCNPKLTRIEDFQIRRDRELLKDEAVKPFIPRGIEIIPTLLAEAIPSGPVERETYLYLKADILRHIRACKGIEGVCLHLHGAMGVEEIGDGENDFVKSVRELVGPDVLISVSLDLHGNISPGLLKFADIFTAYRTAPHIDRMETRERALSLLVNCTAGWPKSTGINGGDFRFTVHTGTIDETIKMAQASDKKPVFISDSGDNVTSGDLPHFIERLLSLNVKDAAVGGIIAPDAVARCREAGIGSSVEGEIGGKLDRVNGYPLKVKGKVMKLTGDGAVLRIEGVDVILTARRQAFTTVDSFRSYGD
ncbi:hypothetical protein ES703_43249 [subsurface metagenome]